jgi:hypothetical protein
MLSEFDWCSVGCVRALKQLGIDAIMVNSNPESALRENMILCNAHMRAFDLRVSIKYHVL